ncbi:hypothetical protein DSCW_51920 [Desulfosarcina widdelii]|uniref:DUF3631 domain-containing protein n=1 Tax=Desulfosarcina widdelii TaxID=947919 RepID=A0A5K7ZAM0_9BACT|nr:hypothetical protein [Desulfosarcina widdelii]BBO77775.1 hypothetical protein DSCW_51920 [Desulfosarcina widdelii]
MEPLLIDLTKTQRDLFEYQPDHHHKDSNNFQITHAKLLHPAIDFKPEGMVIGFSILVEGEDGAEERNIHIVCDDQGFRMEATNHVLFLGKQKYLLKDTISPPLVNDRWVLEKMVSNLSSPAYPSDIFETIKLTIQRYADLQDDGHYGLIAVWAISSYFTHLFPAFPFLLFFGPKESGKSKVLEIINLMAFNPVKVKTISEAALCDTTDGLRGTVLIDQAEALPFNMVGLLADSYKKAGAKRRIIGHRDGKRVIREYSGYGPKAFATTKALDPDLKDRCCQILMQRSVKPLPDIFGYEPEWAAIRDMCYRFLLLKWHDVQSAYMQIPFTGNRKGELWRPLESILRVLKVPQREFEYIKRAFEQGTEKTKDRLSDVEEALFDVLLDQARHNQKFEMTTHDLVDKLKMQLDRRECPTPQGLGNLIAIYNLADDKKKRTRQKLVHYLFSADRVKDLASRYLD